MRRATRSGLLRRQGASTCWFPNQANGLHHGAAYLVSQELTIPYSHRTTAARLRTRAWLTINSATRPSALRPRIRWNEVQLWVETTRRRAAAYGHRAFNAGFPAMNPIGRPSQPDPNPPFGSLQSCPMLSVGFSCFASTKQPLAATGTGPGAVTWQRLHAIPIIAMANAHFRRHGCGQNPEVAHRAALGTPERASAIVTRHLTGAGADNARDRQRSCGHPARQSCC